MPITTFQICLIFTETVFYTFLGSFLLLLFAKCRKGQKFYGAFYNIIRVIFLADLLYIIMMILARAPGFGILPSFFKANGYLAAIAFDSTAFLAFVQFTGQACLAFNRFTSIWFPIKHANLWSRQWYTVIIILIPFLAIIHRFNEPGVYQYKPNGDVVVRLVRDEAMNICYIVTAVALYSMTTIGLVFNILAVVKIYFFKKENVQSISKKDAHLLYVSCILFLIQCLRCAYNLIRYIFADNEAILIFLQTILPLIADIYAWIGSLSLLFLSPSTRQAYLNFFDIRKCKNLIYPFNTNTTMYGKHPTSLSTRP